MRNPGGVYHLIGAQCHCAMCSCICWIFYQDPSNIIHIISRKFSSSRSFCHVPAEQQHNNKILMIWQKMFTTDKNIWYNNGGQMREEEDELDQGWSWSWLSVALVSTPIMCLLSDLCDTRSRLLSVVTFLLKH